MVANVLPQTSELACATAMSMFAEIQKRLVAIETSVTASIVREAYTIDQAAERLPYKKWTIRQACNTGRILAKKTGNGEWCIPHAELLRLEANGLGAPTRTRGVVSVPA